MEFKKTVSLALSGLLASVLLSACQVSASSGSGENDRVFLEALSGPIREKYSDSVLIAEGHKACDAFAQGQDERQVMAMIKKDLNVDAGQFIGAVYAGMGCNTG